MCNQFRTPSLAKIKQYLVNDLSLPYVEQTELDFPSQDIFPNQPAPVLLYDGQLHLEVKSWGYASPIDQKPLFNARVERFFDAKPSMWDESFAKRRCLILADQFYESSPQTYTGKNGRRYHERYLFQNPAQPITLIAGIYERDRFSMVTTAPNSTMAPIHNRMPLVIAPDELRQWLFQNFTSLIDRSDIQLTYQKQAHK